MTALVQHAGVIYTRYYDDLVQGICNNNEKELIKTISDGAVQKDEAQRLATALGIKLPFLDKDIPESAYSIHMKQLGRFGLCSACESNVATHLSEQPNSRCTALANKALSGDEDSINKLSNFPDYCKIEWH